MMNPAERLCETLVAILWYNNHVPGLVDKVSELPECSEWKKFSSPTDMQKWFNELTTNWREGRKVISKILTKIAELDAPQSNVAVVFNPETPPEWLCDLAESGELAVKSFMASNQGLPYEAAMTLASDPDDSIRMAVAKNYFAPIEALKALANGDANAEVRNAAIDTLGHRFFWIQN